MSNPDLIKIPVHARNWRVNQLPVSTRLRTVLRRGGRSTLGAFHGMSLDKLFHSKGCGVHSFNQFKKFLRSLHAGELDERAAVSAAAVPRTVIKWIDQFCDQMDPRDQRIFLARMGARGAPLTLDAIGIKHGGLTRERIRQIIDTLIAELSRSGGPPFVSLVRTLIAKLQKVGRVSSPEELAVRLGVLRVKGRYPVGFYGEVLYLLRRAIAR